ncbi:hypothetical protein Q5752_006502 [Cryptotrichosporon argae]
MAAPQHIVVVGGGIAGVSTAYFLATSLARPAGSTVTLVEGTRVAAGASGYSGGFLARDWHGAATASLSAMSYDLHKSLADEFGGRDKWGYRAVDTLSVTSDLRRVSKKPSPLPWLPAGTVHGTRHLGGPDTTAQVHPGEFTRFFAEQFAALDGCALVVGRVAGLALDDDGGRPTAVVLESGSTIKADTVVLAPGPWLGALAERILPPHAARTLAVTGHRAHSVVIKTKDEMSAHCLFTDITEADGSSGEPEVYPRPDGTTYICGSDDTSPLPATAADVCADPAAIARLHRQAAALSPVFTPAAGATTVAEQACFLPIPDRGRPLVGPVPGLARVYVAGGHSCWGVTQGPGTGKVLAELILEGAARSADISKLAP